MSQRHHWIHLLVWLDIGLAGPHRKGLLCICQGVAEAMDMNWMISRNNPLAIKSLAVLLGYMEKAWCQSPILVRILVHLGPQVKDGGIANHPLAVVPRFFVADVSLHKFHMMIPWLPMLSRRVPP